VSARLKKLAAQMAALDEEVGQVRSAIERANRDLAAAVQVEQEARREVEEAKRAHVASLAAGEKADRKTLEAAEAKLAAARAAADDRRGVVTLLEEQLEERERLRRSAGAQATLKTEEAILRDLGKVWDAEVRPLLVEHAALHRIGPNTTGATRVATPFFATLAGQIESHALGRKLPGGGISDAMFEADVDKLLKKL